MEIRPIDIMKTQEVSQIKQMENQKLQHAQDQGEKNFQNSILQDRHKPTEATKLDNNGHRHDAKEKGNNEYHGSGGNKNDKNKEKEKESKKPQKSGGIDLLI
jgi:hypothetical protein